MKMSDALRAAADTAPVDEVHVSTSAVRSRARRHRALRATANGVVGVGAAALVFAGVAGAVANQSGLAAGMAPEDGRDDSTGGTAQGDVGVIAPGFDAPGGLATLCGQNIDFSTYPTGAVTVEGSLGDVADLALPVDLTFDSSAADPVVVGAATHYILWQDLIVGTADAGFGDTAWDPSAEPTLTLSSDAKLLNCWDQTALPAGDYTIVTVVPVTADVPPVAEPTAAPSTAPSPPSEPAPDDPNTSVSSDATGDVAVAPLTYAVTDPEPFTIPGDPVANPFDSYLKGTEPGPTTTPVAPSDALTTDEARAAYNSALLTGAWDMAPGTSRVVKTGDSKDTSDDAWTRSYYGCPTDGATATFPKESADLDWLAISASLPSAVHVSYGWVVDGNPQVSVSIKNTSKWSLPGFYQGSSPVLELVKDGKVAAEAYPVSLDRDGWGIAYAADDSAAGAASSYDANLIYAPAGDGYLGAGDTLSGDYLWRDVNGCWDGTTQPDVKAGTYTVLTSQSIYVGPQYAVMEDVAPSAGSDSGASDGSGGADAPIAAPDESDYVSFQVWTSLGSVTISN